jgi:hypothetical protein
MGVNRRRWVAALSLTAAVCVRPAYGQSVQYEDGADGIRWQITKQTVATPVLVPTTVPQQQTTYRQQVTTDNVPHQQVYNVPITQYQIVSELHGRWNPFITPYWTQRYEPVTTWQQQVATVNIPVTRVAWVPETKTVQQTVNTWKTVNSEIVRRDPIGAVPSGAGSNTAMAAARPLTSSSPSATLTPTDSASASIASRPVGGTAMQSDPPKQAGSGWQSPPATSGTRY